MDWLIKSRSICDADQVLSSGNPRNGGGPLNPIESTYSGAGLRVDLVGRWFEFGACEFTASAACVGGATGLFILPPSCNLEAASDSVEFGASAEEVEVAVALGLPSLGLTAGAARESG